MMREEKTDPTSLAAMLAHTESTNNKFYNRIPPTQVVSDTHKALMKKLNDWDVAVSPTPRRYIE